MAEAKTICVYCASSNRVDAIYGDTAKRLGALLASEGMRLVTGGGAIGLMNDALIVCIDDFRAFWGTRLLSAELAIHQVIINGFDEEEEPETNVNPLLL